ITGSRDDRGGERGDLRAVAAGRVDRRDELSGAFDPERGTQPPGQDVAFRRFGLAAIGAPGDPAQGGERYRVAAPLVAPERPPATGWARRARGRAAHGDRPRAGDDPQAPAIGRAGSDDEVAVVGEHQALGPARLPGPEAQEVAVLDPIESRQPEARR